VEYSRERVENLLRRGLWFVHFPDANGREDEGSDEAGTVESGGSDSDWESWISGKWSKAASVMRRQAGKSWPLDPGIPFTFATAGRFPATTVRTPLTHTAYNERFSLLTHCDDLCIPTDFDCIIGKWYAKYCSMESMRVA